MTDVRQFDPSAWVSGDFTSANPDSHANQRFARGFSEYDWYNFNTYLAFLFARVCEEIITEKIKVVENNVHKAARLFLNEYVTAYMFHDLTAQDTVSESGFVEPFFRDIFPNLPASSGRYYTPSSSPDRQRTSMGISDADLPVARSYLAAIMIDGLSLFASPLSSGYPSNSTPEEWVSELHDMQFFLFCHQGMDMTSDDDIALFSRGRELIIKRFPSLWD